MTVFDPSQDGITHINIYSKGQTELGRLMSNFAYSPFFHPLYGKFNSVEGLWYWLSIPYPNGEPLRELSGYEAKREGRKLRGKDCSTEVNMFTDFGSAIKDALTAKLASNERLQTLLKESTLPFIHYYVMDEIIIPVHSEGWIIEHWKYLRLELQKD